MARRHRVAQEVLLEHVVNLEDTQEAASPPRDSGSGKRRRVLSIIAFLVGLAVLLLLPSLMPNDYVRGLVILGMIYSIYGIGFDVQFGYAGVFNLGHGMFFGIGAYVTALLSHYFDITNILVSVPLSVISGLIVGGIVCVLALRRDGLQLAMITLGLSQMMYLIVLNEEQITRGPIGMSVGSPTIGIGPWSMELSSQFRLYIVVLFCLFCSVYLVRRVLASRLGSSWLCVRENIGLARSQGVNPVRARAASVLFGAGLASAGGALFAYNLRFLTPELFALLFIVTALVIVIVGGSGTTYGAILGAFLFAVVPEVLRSASDHRLLVFGLILAVVMLVLPQGLYPLLARTAKRIFGTARSA